MSASSLRLPLGVARNDFHPDVPAVAETYKDYEVDVWFGVAAPARTPKAALSELIGWFSEAMRSPEIVAKLDPQGLYPAVVCGEANAPAEDKNSTVGTIR